MSDVMSRSTANRPSPRRQPLPVALPEDEGKVIHEYDGIEECDHHLPNWWMWILYGSVAFAVMYWFHFQVFNSGDNPGQSFHKEMQAYFAAEAEKIRAAGVMDDKALLALAKDDNLDAQGKEIFTTVCYRCHGANGGGGTGPNLTDNSWLYGGRPEQIYKTVSGGTKNGMPAWLPQLGIGKVQAAVVHVLRIRNTNVAGGKAPQGTVEN